MYEIGWIVCIYVIDVMSATPQLYMYRGVYCSFRDEYPLDVVQQLSNSQTLSATSKKKAVAQEISREPTVRELETYGIIDDYRLVAIGDVALGKDIEMHTMSSATYFKLDGSTSERAATFHVNVSGVPLK